MMDPNVTEDWLKLSSDGSFTGVKTRKKRETVSVDQREMMFEFISGNPELITHSSTKECELELWTELTKKMNELQPLKSLNTWRAYWKRWMDKVLLKPESALTLLDSKVKKFLTNLGIDENKENKSEVNNIEDVNSSLKDLEAEKAKLTLEIDRMDCRIVQYKTSLKELSRVVQEKRKRLKDIVSTKKLLNEKKRKLEQNELSANDSDV